MAGDTLRQMQANYDGRFGPNCSNSCQTLAKHWPKSPKIGRTRLKVGPNRQNEFGGLRTEEWSTAGQIGRIRANLGRFRAELAQVRVKVGPSCRATLVALGRKWVDFGPRLVDSGAMSVDLGPTKIAPGSAKSGPNPAKSDPWSGPPSEPDFLDGRRSISAQLGLSPMNPPLGRRGWGHEERISTAFGRAKLGPVRPNLGCLTIAGL